MSDEPQKLTGSTPIPVCGSPILPHAMVYVTSPRADFFHGRYLHSWDDVCSAGAEKKWALETSRRELSEYVSFGIGSVLTPSSVLSNKSSLVNRSRLGGWVSCTPSIRLLQGERAAGRAEGISCLELCLTACCIPCVVSRTIRCGIPCKPAAHVVHGVADAVPGTCSSLCFGAAFALRNPPGGVALGANVVYHSNHLSILIVMLPCRVFGVYIYIVHLEGEKESDPYTW